LPEARPFRARLSHLAGSAAKGADLAGITTIAAANRWLAETYWPAHNAVLAVAQPKPAALSPTIAPAGYARSCASKEERRVGRRYRQVARPHRDPAEIISYAVWREIVEATKDWSSY
jgi:hypothetical protein